MQRTTGLSIRVAFIHALLGALAVTSNHSVSLAGEQASLGPAGQLVQRPAILVIAHRGDSKVAPENTLPAFASAVKAGADLVELDYYNSADGIPGCRLSQQGGLATGRVRPTGGLEACLPSQSR